MKNVKTIEDVQREEFERQYMDRVTFVTGLRPEGLFERNQFNDEFGEYVNLVVNAAWWGWYEALNQKFYTCLHPNEDASLNGVERKAVVGHHKKLVESLSARYGLRVE